MIKNFLFSVLISSSLLIAEVIIDVRTPEEFQSARLNKAINIEWQNILSIQNNINKTYCAHCNFIYVRLTRCKIKAIKCVKNKIDAKK